MNKHRHSVPRHLIGGIAFTDGVVLHTPDAVAISMREHDGRIATTHWKLSPEKKPNPLLHLFGVRGLWLLWRTIVINSRMRAFMAEVVQSLASEAGKPMPLKKALVPSLFPAVGLLVAFFLYAEIQFLFILYHHLMAEQYTLAQSDAVTMVSGALLIIYIVWKGGIWSYMGYHGAQHQAISAYEHGERTMKAVSTEWPYQTRCGAAVVSYVALFLGIIGYYYPAISFLGSIVLALALFSLSYELVSFLDRHNDQVWAKILSLPGVILQFLVARRPTEGQSELAAQALFALTEESAVLKSHSKKMFDMPLA